MLAHIILYVKDQVASSNFYRYVLDLEPVLDVPGMTEFKLSDTCVLGLMPEKGIKKLLGEKLPDPNEARGIPRAEVYLVVDSAAQYYERALQKNASALSALSLRDWGDQVAYCLDLDAHVLAFAQRAEKNIV
ncbi:MAG: VOC family protein [Candidatus Obscuribacterales bacterium]|jgi:catechol 2,3-dioxygenase-like lactoylglutathione lyase family enzyme